jgi:hypothetical protein
MSKERKEDTPTSQEERTGHTCNVDWINQGRKGGIVGFADRGEAGFLKRRTASTSVSPSVLSIANCLVTRVENNTMYLPMKLLSEKQPGIEIVEEGFLDSGAGGKFIDQNYVKAK